MKSVLFNPSINAATSLPHASTVRDFFPSPLKIKQTINKQKKKKSKKKRSETMITRKKERKRKEKERNVAKFLIN